MEGVTTHEPKGWREEIDYRSPVRAGAIGKVHQIGHERIQQLPEILPKARRVLGRHTPSSLSPNVLQSSIGTSLANEPLVVSSIWVSLLRHPTGQRRAEHGSRV